MKNAVKAGAFIEEVSKALPVDVRPGGIHPNFQSQFKAAINAALGDPAPDKDLTEADYKTAIDAVEGFPAAMVVSNPLERALGPDDMSSALARIDQLRGGEESTYNRVVKLLPGFLRRRLGGTE